MKNKKSFSGPKSFPVKKDGQVKGMKNNGGLGGRTSQPNTKPHKGKTNP